MATKIGQTTGVDKADILCEVNMATGLNRMLCEEDNTATSAGLGQIICEEQATVSVERDMTPGIGHCGLGDDCVMGTVTGSRTLDGEGDIGELGCSSSERGGDMALGAMCRPVCEGVVVSGEVKQCQRGICEQDAEGGVGLGLADQCMMSDEDEDQQMVAMDSSNIIPEAAMKCGILPIDSAEEYSLVQMSGESVLQSPVDRSPDQQQQQQLCVGCKRPITERYLLKVMDQFWHEDCLKCSCCDCRLGEVGSTLFTKANLLLCRRDYLRLFGATGCCSVCSKMIPAFEMVMKAKGNVYHLECFACQQCNHRFCIGDRYYLYDNKILCEFDYEERIVFARLSHGYNALSNIKRQAQSINGLPANNCRSSNLNGC